MFCTLGAKISNTTCRARWAPVIKPQKKNGSSLINHILSMRCDDLILEKYLRKKPSFLSINCITNVKNAFAPNKKMPEHIKLFGFFFTRAIPPAFNL